MRVTCTHKAIIAWSDAIFKALGSERVFDDDAIDAERIEQRSHGGHADAADWIGADEFGEVAAGQAGELIEAFTVDGEFGNAGADRSEQAGVIREFGDDAAVHSQPLALRLARSSAVPMLLVVVLASAAFEFSTLSTASGFACSLGEGISELLVLVLVV